MTINQLTRRSRRNQSPRTVVAHLKAILARVEDSDFTSLAEDRAIAKAIEIIKADMGWGGGKTTKSEVAKLQLRAFYADEMSKCVDIVKLRKLALCRLGDPRYHNYRQRYFDGRMPS